MLLERWCSSHNYGSCRRIDIRTGKILFSKSITKPNTLPKEYLDNTSFLDACEDIALAMAPATGIYIHSSSWGRYFPFGYYSFYLCVIAACGLTLCCRLVFSVLNKLVQAAVFLFCGFSIFPRHRPSGLVGSPTIRL
jgi:hypothetical protein